MRRDRRGDEITPQAPEWAFEGRVPRGAITLVVGRDGTGKSTLACGLAAAWTRGELTGRPERVHLALAEDDVAAVTVPRLRAAGADMALVRLPGHGQDWVFPRDCEALRAYIEQHQIDIVILDPLDHYARVNGQRAREELDALRAVAEATGATLVIIHHFTKSGASVDQAIGGQRAVKAVARSILIWGPVAPQGVAAGGAVGSSFELEIGDDEDINGDIEVEVRPCAALAHHKCSYGAKQPTLLYTRNDTDPPGFDLVGDCEITAPEVFAGTTMPTVEQVNKRQVARDLIVRFLSGVPRTGEDLASDVMAASISQTTFERARAELAHEGVIERYQERHRHWWRIAVPVAPPED